MWLRSTGNRGRYRLDIVTVRCLIKYRKVNYMNFPPIEDLMPFGNCVALYLADRQGGIVWATERMDASPSYLQALLGDKSKLTVVPSKPELFASTCEYIQDTNVLKTTWTRNDGTAAFTTTDCLIWTGRGSPHILLRHVGVNSGTVSIKTGFRPLFNYGQQSAVWLPGRTGVGETIELRTTASSADMWVCTNLASPGKMGALEGERTLSAGESAFFALGFSSPERLPRTAEAVWKDIEETIENWRSWLKRGNFPSKYQHTKRWALTLKLLQFEETGAYIAGGSMSLPEDYPKDYPRIISRIISRIIPLGKSRKARISDGRTWDYRFTWPRDAARINAAFLALGFIDEVDSYERWVLSLENYTVLYNPFGGLEGTEERVLPLPGYMGTKPVRVGNGAALQQQHDLFYYIISVLCQRQKRLGVDPDLKAWRMVKDCAERALECISVPDAGIWEVRGKGERVFASSQAYVAGALKLAAEFAELIGENDSADKWRLGAQDAAANVYSCVYDGVIYAYAAPPDLRVLDASVLLIPLDKLLPVDVDTIRSTTQAIIDGLSHEDSNGLIYRYRGLEDGLEGGEHVFTFCVATLIRVLAQLGDSRAEALFDRLVSFNPIAEEISVVDRKQSGNVPQGFALSELICAACEFSSK